MKNLVDFLAGIHRRSGNTPAETAAGRNAPVCPACGQVPDASPNFPLLRVCSCGHHFPMGAWDRIRLLADEGTFKEVNRTLASVDPLAFSDRVSYPERLQEAQRKTGLADAVITGTCTLEGRPVVLAVVAFEFMGGSMGSVVGERIALAFELARRRSVPIITVTSTGGARMQEGMLSLVQMAKTAASVQRLRTERVPYVSVLAHPTTGGIYASFASLGDFILAEPGAMISFAGPRVIQGTTGQAVEEASLSAESLLAHGMVDRLVPRHSLRDTISLFLQHLDSPYRLTTRRAPSPSLLGSVSATPWETVQLARHGERPTSRDYIQRMVSSFLEVHGDRLYGDDPAVSCGLGEISGQPVVLIAQERGHGESALRPLPEGYRKALRMMRIAARFQLPVVTLIDTPGAQAGPDTDARGLAGAMAECLATMSSLPVPVVAAVIGEGGSGGALALGVADRILMMENAVYSVISPEGASAILYRDASKAPELAPALRVTARDCVELGVADRLVPEPTGGAHLDPDSAARHLKTALLQELTELLRVPPRKLVEARYRKFRRMGETGSIYREAVARELSHLGQQLQQGIAALRDRLRHGEQGEPER